MSDKYAVPNKLPGKQVNVLARRKSRIREEKSHHHVKQLNRGFKLKKKKQNYKKPEHFIMQWRRATRDSKRMQRVLSKPNFLADVPKEDEQKVVVVFRHRAHHIANEECHKILESLGLGRLHKTVLLKNTPETVALLKIVDPYVCYGYPNIQTVRDLIFKHGFLRINGKKTAISSNKLIEDHLGEHGCICIEDVVHDLFTVSDNFKNVRQMLIPFKLKPPKDGWSKKIGVDYQRGGEYGNRGTEINALITRCL